MDTRECVEITTSITRVHVSAFFPAGSAAHYGTNTSITNLPLSYLQTETFTLNNEDLWEWGAGPEYMQTFLWSSKFRIVSLIWATERADLKWFPASLLQTLTRWGLQTTEETWRRALDMHNHMWFSWWGKETACVCPPVCITLRGELKTIAHHSA